MKKQILLLWLMCALLLVGCTQAGVDHKAVLILLPLQQKLISFDPVQKKVTGSIDLGHPAYDLAVAPNGKLYIPLYHKPGVASYMAVLTPEHGELKKIPSPLAGLGTIQITSDGTAFVASGHITTAGTEFLQFDTNTDQVTRTILVPGTTERFLTRLPDDQVVVPTTRLYDWRGQLFLLRRDQREPVLWFPFELELKAPSQIILRSDGEVAYFRYNGVSPDALELRQELAAHVSDPAMLEAHIDVWDLKKRTLLRRIMLHLPRAHAMVMGPDGRLYVGHGDESPTVATNRISVVNPTTGEVQEQETVREPVSLMVQDGRLFVGSGKEPVMDLFLLPDLIHEARVTLPGVPKMPSPKIPSMKQ